MVVRCSGQCACGIPAEKRRVSWEGWEHLLPSPFSPPRPRALGVWGANFCCLTRPTTVPPPPHRPSLARLVFRSHQTGHIFSPVKSIGSWCNRNRYVLHILFICPRFGSVFITTPIPIPQSPPPSPPPPLPPPLPPPPLLPTQPIASLNNHGIPKGDIAIHSRQ
ncbi:hypothetical protein E2C01_060016 [Portunus trituberculatus]|uniref:Uncharacterized protein n=1 Tax=Portunus trituberculatus TaxID=210409 RepID=A0A5B7HA80_PORTR|nr:hypothetical protein [Portunus trituberculatus]